LQRAVSKPVAPTDCIKSHIRTVPDWPAPGVGFVPIRKKGKLPFTTVEEAYELEYGSATVEMHTDAVKAGDRVVLIDDLIATGGTMMAGMRLLERLGASVIEGAAIVDVPEL
jgi:adenine phosphoribosyltransferase